VEAALSIPTKVSICSSALNLLGEASIASLEEDTDTARTCAQLYDNLKWALIAAYPWSFSKKKTQLARDVAAPTSRWRYQFALPVDRVGDVFALLPSAGVPGYTLTDFEIHGNHLLSNHSELWLDYQYDRPEADLPPHFVQLFIYAMAADLCMPITHDTTMMPMWRTVAYGTPSENNRGGYFRTATSIDSRGRPAPSINSDDLIIARMA